MNETRLPPGQHELQEFPRFGLTLFASRFPKEINRVKIRIDGDVRQPIVLSEELGNLLRVSQTTDFHCVTTWSVRSLQWAGVRFSDFFEQIVVPKVQPEPDAKFVVFRCQDGYSASLPLDDLLAEHVIMADELGGQALTVGHGAPLRLVVPAHYGYKNPKHLCGIEFWRDGRHYRSAAYRFMDHPRGRVALEERGRGVPGRLLRTIYRPFVQRTIRLFQQELDDHYASDRPAQGHS